MYTILNKLTIKSKIKIISFSAIIIILILTLGSFLFFNNIIKNLEDMKSKEIYINNLSHLLIEDISKIDRNMLISLLLSNTIENIKKDELLEEIKELNTNIIININAIEKYLDNNKNQKTLRTLTILNKLRIRYNTYYTLIKSLPTLLKTDKSDMIDTIIGIYDINDKMFEELELFKILAEKKFNKRMVNLENNLNQISNTFLLIAIFSLLCFSFFGYILNKTIMDSLNKLDKGIEKFFLFLSQKTEKVYDIEIQYNDELSDMAHHINTNIHKAEILIETQKNFTNKLEHKVKEKTSKIVSRSHYLQQYKDVINQVESIIKFNTNGIITYANNNFIKLSKYNKSDIVGSEINKFLHDCNFTDLSDSSLLQTLNSGNIYNGINCDLTKDGKEYTTKTIIIPMKNIEHHIEYFFCIRSDITKELELSKDIIATQKDIIATMGQIGETRSLETGNHVRRVAHYSKLLAKLYGLNRETCELLFTVSPMHDIGKIGIPDSILKKPGKLTESEFEIMKTHTTLGYDMLKHSTRDIIQAAAIIAYEHHEKWDGTGYPNKLYQDEINIFARITAIVDVFDALGSNRVYKKAWEIDKILNFIQDEKGKMFDPQLTDLFLNNIDQFIKIKNSYNNL